MWSSSAPEVATVSSDGTVSAISAGTAVISATVGEKSDSVTVTVSAAQPQNVPVASVSVSPETPILSVIPLQALAYYTALFCGNDPDKPRNLAKSVTVE